MPQPFRLSHVLVAAVTVCVVGAWLSSSSAQSSQGALAPYRNRNRVLIVFAPSVGDVRYQEQVARLTGETAGEQDRNLVRFAVFETGRSRGPRGAISTRTAQTLRDRYQVRRGQFRVLLVGKDGNVAYGQTSPVSAADLFARIDRMPMRRAEMRRITGGKAEASVKSARE